MLKSLDKLKTFIEKGARNNASDAKAVQAIHDHSTSMGAQCATSTSAKESSFSHSDLMTILTSELREDIAPNAYILDVFDTTIVYCEGYDWSGGNSNCYQIDYSCDDSGEVTWGEPVEVVRKVSYVATVEETPTESGIIELSGETIPLLEANLSEASRMIKLISPGWGSSGYYSEAVLKRDGPNVFKAGTHNYIDHPTSEEEKKRPEGTLTKLASTLKEDAKWYDDYAGNGPGLYAPTNENADYSNFLNTFKNDIGTSIRANGKASMGEAVGKKGPIIEQITAAKSVDYVTIPGAGGKVLELFESSKTRIVNKVEKEVTQMADNTDALQESINKMNVRFVRGEAMSYVAKSLLPLKVKEAIKDRISNAVLSNIPLTEAGEINTIKFDESIKTAIEAEMRYLTEAGAFGQIKGFGATVSSNPTDTKVPVVTIDAFKESLSVLD